MRLRKPPSPPRSKRQPPKDEPLTELRSVELPRLRPLTPTSLVASPSPPSTPEVPLRRLKPLVTREQPRSQSKESTLPKLAPLETPVAFRILSFDLETVAAGYGDPEWVPHKITCVAWSWCDEDEVEVRISTSEGLFSRPERRRKMLEPLVEAVRRADMVTGHNVLRFDLPVLNSECLRLGLPSLPALLVQDTMRLVRTKGFKKGQDNLGRLLQVPDPKMPLSWQEWQHAYEEKGWETVRERCASDVRAQKELRRRLYERGWLRGPVWWRP